MSSLPTGPIYGLEVPPGEHLIAAFGDFPVSLRITMAAIDPTADPKADEDGNVPAVPRSTLRIVKRMLDEDEDDDDDDDHLRALLQSGQDDSDDEPNGGPSDPVKAKQKKTEAAIRKLIEAAQNEEDSDDEMANTRPNGIKANGTRLSKKGKEKAVDVSDEDEDDEDTDSEGLDGLDLEQFVLCTLDTERTYQQPLDITIKADEHVFFTVSGTHAVYLTGNYILDDDSDVDSDEDDEDYGLPIDVDDISDAESDELDGLEDPRITEVDSDDEAPQLVETKPKKGKNKRPAEDEIEGLDELISKDSKVDSKKASKQQQKKLKNNKGQAISTEETSKPSEAPKDSSKTDKKVQFAKQLEQGPTPSAGSAEKAKAEPTVRTVQGVTIDDRTLGKGRKAKKGDRVSVRYIGKLLDGKVFDANKKGKPFQFTVGEGEVIKGWDIGVEGMAAGGERRLTIPAKLAYGSRKMGEIPANSSLKFDIKLLEVK
jgi:FK506-binding nuclear protein